MTSHLVAVCVGRAAVKTCCCSCLALDVASCWSSLPLALDTRRGSTWPLVLVLPCAFSRCRSRARRLRWPPASTRAPDVRRGDLLQLVLWRATLLRAISRYCPCSTLDIATRCRLCQTRGGGDVFLLVLGARRCLMLALAAARARKSMLLLPIGLDALIALRSHSTSYSEPLLSCPSLRAFRGLLVFDLCAPTCVSCKV